MFLRIVLSLLIGAGALAASSHPLMAAEKPASAVPPALNFTMKDIQGKAVPLKSYQGQVILVVNVASQCGNTRQYAGLQSLYEKYRSRGFVVLGFPSNDFGSQEPGTEAEIQEFCTTNFGVTFPMFSKIAVKGATKAPFYGHLTDKKTNPKFGGDIEWNFAKFLIGRNGEVIARFPAGMAPDTTDVVERIEKALAESRGK
jgi:glutathione peroxidase